MLPESRCFPGAFSVYEEESFWKNALLFRLDGFSGPLGLQLAGNLFQHAAVQLVAAHVDHEGQHRDDRGTTPMRMRMPMMVSAVWGTFST